MVHKSSALAAGSGGGSGGGTVSDITSSGGTITVTNATGPTTNIDANLATSSTAGIVRPDDTTITINGSGVISTVSGSGTVTSVSGVTANGFAFSISSPTLTPAITAKTTITGILQGNGTAISSVPNGGIANALLANSAITVDAGTGLTGGGSVALGGSITLGLTNTSITVSGVSGVTGGGTVALGSSITLGMADSIANTLAGYNSSGVFSDVSIGSNLTLVSGVLNASGGGGGSPGGSNTQVQYNNSSSFGGITGATTDGTNLLVTTQSITDNSTKAASTAFVQLNSATFTAATANVGGTANAITISATTPSAFTLTDGNIITFTPPSLNTGPTTLNVIGTGATAINKITAAGIGALQAGDIGGFPLICQYLSSLGVFVALNVLIEGDFTSVSTNQSITYANLFTPFVATANVVFSLDFSTNLVPYWYIDIYAFNGTVTVTPQSTESINGGSAGASVVIPKGSQSRVITNAAGNYYITNLQAATVGTINGLIVQGTNITITGSGTIASPYNIAASGGGGGGISLGLVSAVAAGNLVC